MTTLPTLEVLFAPSVVGSGTGTRLVLDIGTLDSGTLGDGSFFYDVSAYVRSVTVNRGRRRALERYTTGTAEIVFSNLDRRFDPTYSGSPYWNSTVGVSGVVPSIPIIIRANWNGTTYPIYRGWIDSWSFAYSPAGKGDATATVQCSDAFKVLSNVVGGLPSSATITSSGTASYDVGVSSIGDSSGFTWLTPASTGSVNVYTDISTTPTIGNGTDLPGVRINAILDAMSWPANLRNIDSGSVLLAPQNATQTPLDMIQEAADSDAGVVYVDSDGTIMFDDRQALLTNYRSRVSQSTYDATDPAGKRFQQVAIVYDDQLIHNVVRVDRKITSQSAGDSLVGTTAIVSNAESISLYGARFLDLTLPIVSDDGASASYGQNVARDLALFLTSIYANPELRPEWISFAPQSNPDVMWPDILSRSIRDRVTVKFAVPGGGATISRECFVEQLTHKIEPGRWEVEFSLSSATFYTGFLILDDTTFGVLDANKLAF